MIGKWKGKFKRERERAESLREREGEETRRGRKEKKTEEEKVEGRWSRSVRPRETASRRDFIAREYSSVPLCLPLCLLPSAESGKGQK